jgi:hypothetical protein
MRSLRIAIICNGIESFNNWQRSADIKPGESFVCISKLQEALGNRFDDYRFAEEHDQVSAETISAVKLRTVK